MHSRSGLGSPHEQAAHRAAQVERREQLTNLVAIPDIAALELGQGHVPTVDVVEDRGDLHLSRILPVSSSCIMPCLSWCALASLDFSAAISASISDRMAAMAVCSWRVGIGIVN